MKRLSLIVGLAAALAASGASAQSINLTGVFRCIQMCRGALPACVTQNGPEFNLLTEAGVPSRAWLDWYPPANRIWVDAFDETALLMRTGRILQ